jgi:5'-nucleotidase
VDALNIGLDLPLKHNSADLMVCGTNFGDNVGLLTQMSCTMNAAVRAEPAVAVSTAIDMELFMRDRQAGYLKPLNAMGDSRGPARSWHRRRESRKTDRSD